RAVARLGRLARLAALSRFVSRRRRRRTVVLCTRAGVVVAAAGQKPCDPERAESHQCVASIHVDARADIVLADRCRCRIMVVHRAPSPVASEATTVTTDLAAECRRPRDDNYALRTPNGLRHPALNRPVSTRF